MTWSTHTMAGLSTLWLLEAIGLLEALSDPATTSIAALVAAAALGSLLPDLDGGQSKIKHLSVSGIKPFYLPSQAIFKTLGHRTLLHSLWGLAGVTVICVSSAALTPWIDWRAVLAMSAGYASHLALDACNPSGIPLFYPNRRKFHLVPRKWRIATGSPPEELVFVFFALLSLLFLLAQIRSF